MSMFDFSIGPITTALMSPAEASELSPEMVIAVEHFRARDVALMEAVAVEIDVQQAVAELSTGNHTVH